MSKLLEKLRKTAQVEHQRIGFGVSAREEKRATMVLIAALPAPDAQLAQRAAKSGADALLVTTWGRPADLQAFKEVATPWGVRLPDHYEGDAESLVAAGCDYATLRPESTRLGVLRWEKVGKALELSPELPDARLRAAEMLPVDLAILDDRGEGPVTVGDLLDLLRLLAFARKPSVLRPRTDLAVADLAALRDSGIAGVVLPVGESGWDSRLRQFREAIDTLPPRAKRPQTPMEAVLPQPRAPETRVEADEE